MTTNKTNFQSIFGSRHADVVGDIVLHSASSWECRGPGDVHFPKQTSVRGPIRILPGEEIVLGLFSGSSRVSSTS
jgi:hypothetical protein